jgi:polyhydroxyalkanoate synthase subunit PhaC
MAENKYINEIIEISTNLGLAVRNASTISIDESQSSSRKVVAKFGKHRLFRYYCPDRKIRTPLLLVYALVNRPNILDLEHERSLIVKLIENGIQPYLLEWGRVSSEDEFTTFADYALKDLAECVDAVLENDGAKQLSLAGICQGGVLSLVHAAARPEKVKNLITLVTPIDFHSPEFHLARLIRQLNVTEITSTLGNISGDVIKQMFLSLNPIKLSALKALDVLNFADDKKKLETYVRMEQWINDSPDQAAIAFQEFCELFFQGNGFISKDLYIDDERIDISTLQIPILNIFARNDHIVPVESCNALEDLVPNSDYHELEVNAGHIGLFITRSALAEVSAEIHIWLQEHDN